MRAFRFPGLLFPAFLGLATACLSTEPDNLPPIVTITQPENRHVVDVGEVVEIVVEASDHDGAVTSVAFYVGGLRTSATEKVPLLPPDGGNKPSSYCRSSTW
jgi:hypothetical protein